MLKITNVSKSYGNVKAVNDLSFSVEDGEIFGLLGENGAGKTTTFRMIMGLIDGDNGTITLDGKPINYSVTDKIGFVTEERSLLTKLTVKEQIIYYGVLKGMSEESILLELDKWLEKFDISSYKNRKIKELSKGNQQKIQFISAVINHPKLLILDEPFTGLDPINVKYLKNAIDDLKKEGCSIIFSSHQMEYIEEFCEKLVILVKGRSVLNGYLKDIKKSYGIKNITIKGEEIDVKKLEAIKGVNSITENPNEIVLSITDSSVVDKVFTKIKDSKILKFEATEPTLNEIFIETVGGINHE